MLYWEHEKGIQRIAELLFEGKLIPIIGSGFTKGCRSKCGTVPDGKQATEAMQAIIGKFSSICLTNADFNKTAERFFSLVPKEDQWNFFENRFTKVELKNYQRDFLSLPWPYIYTLNIDDGIESTQIYTPVLPYHDAKLPTSSIKLLYKLHGDATYEVLYRCEQNIVFSAKQYIEFLTSTRNQTILNAVSSDYKQNNLLFIGCSLTNEPDIQYIYNHSKEDVSPNTIRCILRDKTPTEEERLDMEEYGINVVIVVNDFELFYRGVVREFERLNAQQTTATYSFINPRHRYFNECDQAENLKYFSGENIFQETENCFYKSKLHIVRTCVHEIESQLETNDSVIIRGRRFSGKTFVLSTLAERFQQYTILYFPSGITIDEDVLIGLLKNKTNSLFLFDSNSLTDYSYHQVANSVDLLQKNGNKLVIAINSNDLYLSEALHAETILVPPIFNKQERRLLNPIADTQGLVGRDQKMTNIDYLKMLIDDQKISLSFFNLLPKKFTREETILLILLSVRDKLYFSDISALDIRFRVVDELISRMNGIIEKIPTARNERNRHSMEKLVHNSKYYLLSIMKDLPSSDVIEAILYIVSHLVKDSHRKRLYVETVLFDTLNQLFGRTKGAGKLIFDIYEELSQYLNQDMDYWLQRAKSVYRLRPESYDDLIHAYQYAKKALNDGNIHLKAKAALSTSLICCLLAKQITDPQDVFEYEKEAIVCADEAIFSDYFSMNRGNLKGELRIGGRQPYARLISDVCNKHSEDTSDLSLMWKSVHIKTTLNELEAERF